MTLKTSNWPSLRGWPRVAWALGTCTLVGALLEQHLDPTNFMMLYLAGTVYVASKAGKAPAIATVLGSIFLYSLIFVPPRWSLKPTDPHYWLDFFVMMVVGLIISELAARSREQAVLAEARATRTQALNQLSMDLGQSRDRQAVAHSLCAAVESAVGAECSVLFTSEISGESHHAPIIPADFDQAWADRALRDGVEVGNGTVYGAEQTLSYLPLVVGNACFGVLVVRPPKDVQFAPEDQHLVRALANQAAIALERAELERISTAAAVEAEGERTRNTLLAGISHDFRTPLTTIMGSATLLLEQASAIDEAGRTALLRTLLQEAQRLHVLTSNLLDLTRLDEGAMSLRAEWCPAEELLETARQQMQSSLCGHELIMRAPADALVWCDVRLVDQVLVNLIDNALQHVRPGGKIEATIEVNAPHWTLTVHDDGPGIPVGHEQAIFRKFYRAAGDSDSTGKGLGLAICAAIAALHGGHIRAENAGGAKFTLSLPQPALPQLDLGDESS